MKACAEAAGRVLNRLDQMCRRLVVTGCFDEIFFHGKPVLVGVEPQSTAWALGEHAVDRSGSTWKEALQGFDALEQAVVDGGGSRRRFPRMLQGEVVGWPPHRFRPSIAESWTRTGRSRIGGWQRSCNGRFVPAVQSSA
ncbi:MAG: hypothetical protein KKE86_01560 [Planctomycetes bacterium]|nr:hypothetical protein [Planctomycetota bacterium]